MRPSNQVNQCIRYCLTIAQRRSQVQIHAAVFLSNHYHIVVSDPLGNLPLFSEELNKLIARSLNCLHGRWENFWAGAAATSYVRLVQHTDVLRKMVYALTNPTAALLVARGSDWPGERLFQPGQYRAKKPNFFFRSEQDGGNLPDIGVLSITAAPLGGSTAKAFEEIKQAVEAKESKLRIAARKAGQRFLGSHRVRSHLISQAPASSEPRRGLSPQLACKDKWRRIENLMALERFHEVYSRCRKAFWSGDQNVCFPLGTYQLVRQFGVRVAET